MLILQEYLGIRIAEVERKLLVLQDHWDTEMKFPFSLRRSSFLAFIYDERKMYQSVLNELKKIDEIVNT